MHFKRRKIEGDHWPHSITITVLWNSSNERKKNLEKKNKPNRPCNVTTRNNMSKTSNKNSTDKMQKTVRKTFYNPARIIV